jgi:replication factor A1
MSLSAGCIRRVHTSAAQLQQSDGAIVQVLEVKKIEPKANQSGERYRFVLSDGEYYIQGMLATQLNELVTSQQLRQNSIVQLDEYIANEINGKKSVTSKHAPARACVEEEREQLAHTSLCLVLCRL